MNTARHETPHDWQDSAAAWAVENALLLAFRAGFQSTEFGYHQVPAAPAEASSELGALQLEERVKADDAHMGRLKKWLLFIGVIAVAICAAIYRIKVPS